MWNTSASPADEQLAVARRKFKQTQREKEKVWQEKAEGTAKLRSARLAKEAQEKAELVKGKSRKTSAKTKKPPKSQKQ